MLGSSLTLLQTRKGQALQAPSVPLSRRGGGGASRPCCPHLPPPHTVGTASRPRHQPSPHHSHSPLAKGALPCLGGEQAAGPGRVREPVAAWGRFKG